MNGKKIGTPLTNLNEFIHSGLFFLSRQRTFVPLNPEKGS